MTTNTKLPPSIDQWRIEFDPNYIVSDENWLTTAEETEDILQLQHKFIEGLIVDVGFYVDRYKIYIVHNRAWDKPTEVFESRNTEEIMDKVYELIDKYANG